MPTVGAVEPPVNKKIRLGPEYGVNSQPGPPHQQMMGQQVSSMNPSMPQTSTQIQNNLLYNGQNSQQQYQPRF